MYSWWDNSTKTQRTGNPAEFAQNSMYGALTSGSALGGGVNMGTGMTGPALGAISGNEATGLMRGGNDPRTFALKNLFQDRMKPADASASAAPASSPMTATAGTTSTVDPKAWLTGANQWWNSDERFTGGAYTDPNSKWSYARDNKGFFDPSVGDWVMDPNAGWTGYDPNKRNIGDTYYKYDTQGNQIGTGIIDNTEDDAFDKLVKAGILAGGGLIGANALGFIGAPGAAGASGIGGAPAWTSAAADSQLANVALGDSALAGYSAAGATPGAVSIGGTTYGAGAPAWTTAAMDSQLANAALGPEALSGYQAAGATPSAVNLGSAAGTAVPGLGSVLQQVLGGGKGTGGLGLGDLLGGLYSGYSQNQSSKDMLGWLDRQMASIDNLYAPGSPEHELLKQEMERKDAAAGRNSQYGPRAVDLAGKITGIKAEQKARMASALQGNYRDMFAQDNSDLAGLFGALGKSNSGGGIQNISSIIDMLFD